MRLISCCAVLFLFFVVPAVFGQQSGVFMSTGDVLMVDQDDRLIGELERRRVNLDFHSLPSELTRGDHVRVLLDVFGTSKEFIIRRIQEFVPGVLSISGSPADGSRGTIAVSQGHGHVLGYVELGDNVYRIQGEEPNGTYMALMNPGEMDAIQCGWEEEITAAHSPWESNRMGTSLSGETSPGYDAPENEIPFTVRGLSESIWDPVTLDVLVVYTPSAFNWSLGNEGHIDNTIAQSFNLGQASLDDSGINLELRLVLTEQVAYSEFTPPPPGESGSSGWHLRRLTASPDYNPWGPGAEGYMDEVHDLRDEYGADLVTLFALVQDVGGIAWLIGNVAGTPELGFSVNRVQQMSYTYTMIHEFGHNFGSHHGREQNSNSAGPGGGIFPYSTGWRFSAGSNGYATVLHYGLSGDTRIGFFSSPELLYEGVPMGTYTQAFGPADNARSMREMKRAMTSYRPTQVDPPVAGTSENSITATTHIGGITTHDLTITNNGTSDLVWDLDFEAVPVSANLHETDVEAASILPDAAPSVGGYGNLSPTETTRDGMIYETGFEGDDGFSTGSHLQAGGWVTHSTNIRLGISNQNPSTGNQHIRVPATVPVSGTANYSSSFFGPWPAGTYEMSLDFSVTELGGSNIFVWFLDSRNGTDVAGFLASATGSVFVYDPVAENYQGTSYSWTPGVYSSVTIRIDPDAQRLLYFFDDELIAERELMGRKSIGQIRIQRSQGNATNQLDLDNIRYVQVDEGLTWLTTDTYAGVTPVGGQTTVGLTFDATGSEAGERQAMLVLRSNDPTSTRIEIPVTLNVTVDTEDEGDILVSGLRGNYPNPFIDETRIEYVLAHTGQVRLDVFNVTGQLVQTLVDDVQSPGVHSVTFDSAELASGMYLYRLQTTDVVDTGKMLIVR